MFTGIIQETGRIRAKISKGDSIRFSVETKHKKFLRNVKPGDSISINGACMTVEKKSKLRFRFTTIAESLSKTNLGLLNLKDEVNIEKAMTLNTRLDGHIVQGHVDATGTLKKIEEKEDSREYFIEFAGSFRKNIIPVGSITINGVSLTVAEIVKEDSKNILIKVAIIPHTFKNTNFKRLKENDVVNIEFDMLGKYVTRFIENSRTQNKKPAGK